MRWLAYSDDVCILAESKTELVDIITVFNDVLTEHGTGLSAEKSFWMTLGCSVDQTDREAIQLPCDKIEYTVIQYPNTKTTISEKCGNIFVPHFAHLLHNCVLLCTVFTSHMPY